MNSTNVGNSASNSEITRVNIKRSGLAMLSPESRPTVKTQAVMPCNHYYNVVMSNEQGFWQGRVITFLSLDDWCTLHGYTMVASGSHLYCDPDGTLKTKLWEMDTPPVAS